MSIDINKATITNERFFKSLKSVVELHRESLTQVISSSDYMQYINKNDMPCIKIDDFGTNLNLALAMFHEGDGNFGIEVLVKWDTFSCYPLAYIRTNHPCPESSYSFQAELAELRAMFMNISESDIRNILSKTYVNIVQ